MRKRVVKYGKIQIKEGKKDYNNERSPYWDFINSTNLEYELAIANPDILSENEKENDARLSTEWTIINQVFPLLSKQQQYILIALGQGKTIKEAALGLKISVGAATSYLKRAKQRIQNVFKAIE